MLICPVTDYIDIGKRQEVKHDPGISYWVEIVRLNNQKAIKLSPGLWITIDWDTTDGLPRGLLFTVTNAGSIVPGAKSATSARITRWPPQ